MTEAAFACAVLDPSMPLPEGLVDPQGRPAPRRFDVYRNNVVSGLVGVLEAGFPVVRKLVGATFFAALAGAFVRAHPPRTRIMMLYGRAFPAFLDSFPPVAHLGYLPDVARLELAMRQAYHAADADPVNPQALSALSPERLLMARLALAPALRIVRSSWPVLSIWRANAEDGPAPVMQAESVLIQRPEYDVTLDLLPAAACGVICALQRDATLGEALQGLDAGFDLSALFALLMAGRSITGMTA